MIYLFITIICVVISAYMFSKEGTSLRLTKLNPLSWIFYYNLILQSVIASVLVVNNIDQHYLISKIPLHHPARFYGWLSVMWSLIGIPIGMKIANVSFGIKNGKKHLEKYFTKPLVNMLSDTDKSIRYPLYVLSGISILAIFYVFLTIQSIPILQVFLSRGTVVSALLRQDASRGFQGSAILRNIFAITLAPLLSYIAYLYYKKTKSRKDLIWFLIMLFFSVIILTYDLSKGPIVGYIISFVFITVFLKGKIEKKAIYRIGFAVLILLLILYNLIMNTGGIMVFKLLTNLRLGIPGRILLGQSAGTYFSFYLFPQQYDHIGIASLSSYVEFLGIEKIERSARMIMRFAKPAAVRAGEAGVVNSLFIAEAWANFGLFGAVISPLVIGFFLKLFYNVFLNRKKTPVYLAFFLYISRKLPITGGFNEFIYPMFILIPVLLLILIITQGKILKQINQEFMV